jgi:hypothetical protein
MNRYRCGCGTADEAVNTLVRGKSPFLSLVPEGRSCLGDAARPTVVFAIPFRRVSQNWVFRCGSAKIRLRRVRWQNNPESSGPSVRLSVI